MFTLLLKAVAAPRVTIVIVPGLRASDTTSLPVLTQNINHIAAGFLVCRAGGHTPQQLQKDGRDRLSSLLLTLAAGARTVGPATLSPYMSLTVSRATHASIPAPLWQKIEKYAHAEGYPVEVGIGGDVVHGAGMLTASIADAQLPAEISLSLVMTADSNGETDSSPAMLTLYRSESDSPGGVTARTESIISTWRSLTTHTGLCAVTLWMLYRADLSSRKCMPMVAATHRSVALKVLNDVLSAMAKEVAANGGALILIAPGPARSSPSIDRLAPLVMAGTGIHPGAIQSYSTRLPGIGVNTDLMPTIFRLLKLHSNLNLVGRPLDGDGAAVSLRKLTALHRNLVDRAVSQSRFGGLPTLQILLLMLALFGFIGAKPQIASGASLSLVSIPLALLVLPLLPVSLSLLQGLVIATWLAIWALVGYYNAGLLCNLVAAVCSALIIICVVDLLTGCNLQRLAWMSYSVMEGARYFGIGGEYTGAVLGSAIVVVTALTTRVPRSLTPGILGLFALTLLMAWPTTGAKVGALPTGTCVAGILWVIYSGKRVRPVHVGIAALVVAGILGLLALIDAARKSGETQLGRAFQGHAGGSIAQIATRKLSMSAHLLTHSVWASVLILSLAVVWAGGTRLGEEGQKLKSIVVLSAMCCLVFNDAGPSVAALMAAPVSAWVISKCVMQAQVATHKSTDMSEPVSKV